MRTPRTISALLVAASLLTACSGTDLGEDVLDFDSPAPQETGADGEPAGDGSGDQAQPADGSTGDAGSQDGGNGASDSGDSGDADGGSSGDGDQGGSADTDAPRPEVADLGGVGANGRAMLRGSYPNLLIEIDVQQGVSPTDSAVNLLAERIRQYADKPGGVSFGGGNEFSSSRTEWTAQDLRAVAEQNRNNYSNDETVVVYVLYVQGGFFSDGQETNAIGVAYNGSEMALFPERMTGLGTLLGGRDNIERAVIVHEWGHLLGLVNITYESDISHEDAEHPHHSRNKGSVMYWAIETDLIGQVFSGPPPTDFDDADRADIAGLKSGKY